MAKIVLSKPTSGYNLAAINANFTAIEAEFQDKVLYRNNPVGEANTLETALDANSKRIFNLPTPISPTDAVRVMDAQAFQGPIGLTGATGATGAASTVAGPTGPQGLQGIQGVQGDTRATATAGTTTTLAAGASATVVNAGTTSEAVFNFGIPQGTAGTGVTPQAVGFTLTGGTSPRTATVDKTGTVAMTSDITGGTLAGSFTTLNASGAATFPAGATVTAPALLGYGTGAGGTVTQATSKSTAVTLNKPTGRITMTADALAAGATVPFIVSNSLVTLSDNVVATLSVLPSGTSGLDYSLDVFVRNPAEVVFVLKNISAASRSEAVVINFVIIKGAIA